MYLKKFVYLLSGAADEYVLFGDALLDVRKNVQSGARVLPCDEGTLAEFCHQGLNGFQVGFALLDTTGNALRQQFILVRLVADLNLQHFN